MTADHKYVGPISPAADQFDAVLALTNKIFRSKQGDMWKSFPLVFHRDRLEQMRIFTADDKPVSHVATVTNDVLMFGCLTKIACMGGVCTDESARGHGLAGRLVNDSIEQATQRGATIMLISGDRPLYARRGAIFAGLFHRYTISAEQLSRDDNSVDIVQVTPENCVQALAMSDLEPIHFCRSMEDYQAQTTLGRAAGCRGKTYIVRRSEQNRAVLSVSYPTSLGANQVNALEIVGSRRDALAALSQIIPSDGIETVVIKAYAFDVELVHACEAIGVKPEMVRHQAAVRLLNAEALWRDFLPLLQDRIGEEASRIHLRTESDEMKIHTLEFSLGDEKLTIEGECELTAALFGSPELNPLAEREGPLADKLRKALPLPLPLYGLNYV